MKPRITVDVKIYDTKCIVLTVVTSGDAIRTCTSEIDYGYGAYMDFNRLLYGGALEGEAREIIKRDVLNLMYQIATMTGKDFQYLVFQALEHYVLTYVPVLVSFSNRPVLVPDVQSIFYLGRRPSETPL